MPPCPICKKRHPNSCGLRLFNSENECPICLEKKSVMIALPCGDDKDRAGAVKNQNLRTSISSMTGRLCVFLSPNAAQNCL